MEPTTWDSVLMPFLILGGIAAVVIVWAMFRPTPKAKRGKTRYQRRH